MSALTEQIGGSHYKDMPMQPIELSMLLGFNAVQHTICKYVSRYKNKNGKQDLLKALHCCDLGIALDDINTCYVKLEYAANTHKIYCQKNNFSLLIERLLLCVYFKDYLSVKVYINELMGEYDDQA